MFLYSVLHKGVNNAAFRIEGTVYFIILFHYFAISFMYTLHTDFSHLPPHHHPLPNLPTNLFFMFMFFFSNYNKWFKIFFPK